MYNIATIHEWKRTLPTKRKHELILDIRFFSENIEYKEEVNLSNKLFAFTVCFYGEDLWDFEEKDLMALKSVIIRMLFL